MSHKRNLGTGGAILTAGLAVGLGAWFGVSNSQADEKPRPGLGVEPRPGECVQIAHFGIGEPRADAAKSPREAVMRERMEHPELGEVSSADANAERAERVEADGRKVAAIETKPFIVGSGASETTVWYVTGYEFSAPCDYVNQKDLRELNTAPKGFTPGVPGVGDAPPKDPPSNP